MLLHKVLLSCVLVGAPVVTSLDRIGHPAGLSLLSSWVVGVCTRVHHSFSAIGVGLLRLLRLIQASFLSPRQLRLDTHRFQNDVRNGPLLAGEKRSLKHFWDGTELEVVPWLFQAQTWRPESRAWTNALIVGWQSAQRQPCRQVGPRVTSSWKF